VQTIAVETCTLENLEYIYDMPLEDVHVFVPVNGGFLLRLQSVKAIGFGQVEVIFSSDFSVVVSCRQTVILVSRE